MLHGQTLFQIIVMTQLAEELLCAQGEPYLVPSRWAHPSDFPKYAKFDYIFCEIGGQPCSGAPIFNKEDWNSVLNGCLTHIHQFLGSVPSPAG